MTLRLAALVALLAAVLAPTPAAAVPSDDVPACRAASGPMLPQAYLDLAWRDRDFRWAARMPADLSEVYGEGWERVAGSGMRDSFSFVRFDPAIEAAERRELCARRGIAALPGAEVLPPPPDLSCGP